MPDQGIREFYDTLNPEQKQTILGIARVLLTADVRTSILKKLHFDNIFDWEVSPELTYFLRKHKLKTFTDLDQLGDEVYNLKGMNDSLKQQLLTIKNLNSGI